MARQGRNGGAGAAGKRAGGPRHGLSPAARAKAAALAARKQALAGQLSHRAPAGAGPARFAAAVRGRVVLPARPSIGGSVDLAADLNGRGEFPTLGAAPRGPGAVTGQRSVADLLALFNVLGRMDAPGAVEDAADPDDAEELSSVRRSADDAPGRMTGPAGAPGSYAGGALEPGYARMQAERLSIASAAVAAGEAARAIAPPRLPAAADSAVHVVRESERVQNISRQAHERADFSPSFVGPEPLTVATAPIPRGRETGENRRDDAGQSGDVSLVKDSADLAPFTGLAHLAGMLASVQRKAEQGMPRPTEEARRQAAPHVSMSAGAPIDTATRGALESVLNTDFTGVRVHTDAGAANAAALMGARAFTMGDSIYFAGGAFQPASPDGLALLGHELAHTAQQRGAPLQDTGLDEHVDDADAEPQELEDEASGIETDLVDRVWSSPSAPVPAVPAPAPLAAPMNDAGVLGGADAGPANGTAPRAPGDPRLNTAPLAAAIDSPLALPASSVAAHFEPISRRGIALHDELAARFTADSVPREEHVGNTGVLADGLISGAPPERLSGVGSAPASRGDLRSVREQDGMRSVRPFRDMVVSGAIPPADHQVLGLRGRDLDGVAAVDAHAANDTFTSLPGELTQAHSGAANDRLTPLPGELTQAHSGAANDTFTPLPGELTQAHSGAANDTFTPLPGELTQAHSGAAEDEPASRVWTGRARYVAGDSPDADDDEDDEIANGWASRPPIGRSGDHIRFDSEQGPRERVLGEAHAAESMGTTIGQAALTRWQPSALVRAGSSHRTLSPADWRPVALDDRTLSGNATDESRTHGPVFPGGQSTDDFGGSQFPGIGHRAAGLGRQWDEVDGDARVGQPAFELRSSSALFGDEAEEVSTTHLQHAPLVGHATNNSEMPGRFMSTIGLLDMPAQLRHDPGFLMRDDTSPISSIPDVHEPLGIASEAEQESHGERQPMPTWLVAAPSARSLGAQLARRGVAVSEAGPHGHDTNVADRIWGDRASAAESMPPGAAAALPPLAGSLGVNGNALHAHGLIDHDFPSMSGIGAPAGPSEAALSSAAAANERESLESEAGRLSPGLSDALGMAADLGRRGEEPEPATPGVNGRHAHDSFIDYPTQRHTQAIGGLLWSAAPARETPPAHDVSGAIHEGAAPPGAEQQGQTGRADQFQPVTVTSPFDGIASGAAEPRGAPPITEGAANLDALTEQVLERIKRQLSLDHERVGGLLSELMR